MEQVLLQRKNQYKIKDFQQKRFKTFCSLGYSLVFTALYFSHTSFGIEISKNFKVKDEITLSEISLFCYGTSTQWQRIADQNSILPPYHLRVGQELVLPSPPKLTQKEGHQILLEMWRKRFGLPATLPPPSPINITVAEEKKIEELKIQVIQKLSTQEKTAIDYYSKGEIEYNKNNFKKALEYFQSSKVLDSSHLPTWLYEIRTLQALEQNTAAIKTAQDLLLQKPALQHLPIIRSILANEPTMPAKEKNNENGEFFP